MRCKSPIYAAIIATASGVNFILSQSVLGQAALNTIGVTGQTQADALKNQRIYARATYRSEKFAEALNGWKLIVDRGSTEAYDHYWLGQSYYHLGKYGEAAAAFRQATMLDSGMDDAKVKLAESYLAGKNFEAARSACAEALSTVTDAYARKQLEVMSKIANAKQSQFPIFKFDSAAENPNGGRK